MTTKDDPSRLIERAEDDGRIVHRGECEKCHYTGPWMATKEIASSLLDAHRVSRRHKTNTAASHRFEV